MKNMNIQSYNRSQHTYQSKQIIQIQKASIEPVLCGHHAMRRSVKHLPKNDDTIYPISSHCETRGWVWHLVDPLLLQSPILWQPPSFTDSVTENPTSLDKARGIGPPSGWAADMSGNGVSGVCLLCVCSRPPLWMVWLKHKSECSQDGRDAVPGGDGTHTGQATGRGLLALPAIFPVNILWLPCCFFCTFWKRKQFPGSRMHLIP